MSEVAESDKSGLAACMECPLRESGQCEHWNGKEDDFGLLIGSTLTAKNISLVHNVCSDEQSGIHPDLLTMAEVWLDYNGAYASMADAYGALTAWIDDNGYEVIAAPYDIYWKNHQNVVSNVEQWETEIRFPIAKR